ncbi:MAG: DotU family type IV/VI secretion system protein, partial [Planctomycetota bacterium]
RHFLGINDAGVRFFSRVEEIARPDARTPKDVIQVYHDLLTLGFKGQYAVRKDGQARVASVRSQLYDYLQDGARESRGETSPNAYKGVIKESRAELIPDARVALIFLCAVIALLFVSSYGANAWIRASIESDLTELEDSRGKNLRGGESK